MIEIKARQRINSTLHGVYQMRDFDDREFGVIKSIFLPLLALCLVVFNRHNAAGTWIDVTAITFSVIGLVAICHILGIEIIRNQIADLIPDTNFSPEWEASADWFSEHFNDVLVGAAILAPFLAMSFSLAKHSVVLAIAFPVIALFSLGVHGFTEKRRRQAMKDMTPEDANDEAD